MRKLRNVRHVGAVVTLSAMIASACSIGLSDDDDQAGTESVGVDSADGDSTTTTTEPADGEASESVDEGAESADSESESAEDPGALLLVLDSSGSMNTQDAQGRPLIDGAKEALRGLVDELPEEQHVGLRVYGHRYPNTDQERGCTDTELIHPVEPLDRDGLLTAIDGYQAKGFTPIALSLQEGANDLPPEGPRTIVLVSDGEETCGGDPCQVAEDLIADGVEVVINTVGFALDQTAGDEAQAARDQLACIAEAGNGSFVEAENADQLSDALDEVAREPRGVEGAELVGSPTPREAETGQVNTGYVDTVLGEEVNFYRFEITPGSEVQGELTVLGNPAAAEDCGTDPVSRAATLYPELYVTDAGGREYEGGAGNLSSFDTFDATQVTGTDPVVVEDDEVWLKIQTSTDTCPGQDYEFDVELRLTVLD